MDIQSPFAGQQRLAAAQAKTAHFQGSLPAAIPAPGADTFTRSTSIPGGPQFGHGNSKQHPDIVRGSVVKEAKRLRRAGKLPKGQSVEDYVAAKMEARSGRRYHH